MAAAVGERLMKVGEFADRVGLPRSTAYGVIARREVDVTNVGSLKRPRLRISESALRRYIERRQIVRSA